jgi:hypothetical protein
MPVPVDVWNPLKVMVTSCMPAASQRDRNRLRVRHVEERKSTKRKDGSGEKIARAMLRLKEYKIVGEHVTVRTSEGTIRYVDFIVEKGGEYTSIEVKTGDAVRDASQLAKDTSIENKGRLDRQ